MTMAGQPEPMVADLLSDAKLVAAYGQRAGRLLDAALFSAIADAETVDDLRWSSPQTVALQSAMNKAVQAIAPTTLVDLKSGWDPFVGQGKTRLSKYAFVIVSLLLMMIVAYYTQLYNHGSTLLTGLQKIDDAHPAEKVGQVLRELIGAQQQLRNSLDGGENLVASESYFHQLDDLHDLDQRMSFLLPMAYAFNYETDHPLSLLSAPMSSGPKPDLKSQSWCPDNGASPTVVSDPVQDANAGHKLDILLADYSLRIANFACIESISFPPNAPLPVTSLLTEVNEHCRLIGLWILPALYGALGAMIFYLRAILNPVLPDPPTARILHRAALGGFAGIIIAWFWTPAAGNTLGFANIGFNLFGLAFLVGFSIEVFFTILDRTVAALQGAVNRVGH